jgi:1-acyl-sn-glycerol-3-phosphate acyltransferase
MTIRIGKLIDAPTSTNKEELEAITRKCADVINEMHDLGR